MNNQSCIQSGYCSSGPSGSALDVQSGMDKDVNKKCTWKSDTRYPDWHMWEAGCNGSLLSLSMFPSEHGFKGCPWCLNPIEEIDAGGKSGWLAVDQSLGE